jgi:hypothetical protein
MLRDEQEALNFLLGEEFEMERNRVQQLQEEALSSYDRIEYSDNVPLLHAVMLAEIALQLAGINEKLQPTELSQRVDTLEQKLNDAIKIAVGANATIEDKIESIWGAINALQEYHN